MISANQFFILTLFTMCGTNMITMPFSLTNQANQDGWWIPLLGMIAGLPLVLLIITIARWFPNASLITMLQYLFGHWPGKLVGVLFLFLPILIAPSHMDFFGSFINTNILPSTPFVVVITLFAAVVILAVYKGIETFSRAAELMLVFFLGAVCFFIIFLLPEADLGFIVPFFEQAPSQYIKAVLFFIAKVIGSHAILFLIIFPRAVQDKKRGEQAFIRGYIMACLILFIATFFSVTVLTPEVTTITLFPGFALSQEINIGDMIERLESLLYIIFYVTFFFKMTIYLYAISITVAEIIKAKDYRPLVIPIGMILVVLANTEHQNIIEEYHFYYYGSMILIVVIGVLLPLCMFVVGLVQRIWKKQPIFPRHTSSRASGYSEKNHRSSAR